MNFIRRILGITEKIKSIIICINEIKEHVRITYKKDTFIKLKIDELETLIKGL